MPLNPGSFVNQMPALKAKVLAKQGNGVAPSIQADPAVADPVAPKTADRKASPVETTLVPPKEITHNKRGTEEVPIKRALTAPEAKGKVAKILEEAVKLETEIASLKEARKLASAKYVKDEKEKAMALSGLLHEVFSTLDKESIRVVKFKDQIVAIDETVGRLESNLTDYASGKLNDLANQAEKLEADLEAIRDQEEAILAEQFEKHGGKQEKLERVVMFPNPNAKVESGHSNTASLLGILAEKKNYAKYRTLVAGIFSAVKAFWENFKSFFRGLGKASRTADELLQALKSGA
jgi:hypothetical protein